MNQQCPECPNQIPENEEVAVAECEKCGKKILMPASKDE
jgi:DNA-directed RNA polymerase subunit RPC12/RpoP